MKKKNSPLITQLDAVTLIEIELLAGQTEYGLRDQVLLRDHQILNLVAFSGGKTESGAVIADPTNAYLHLREVTGNQELINLPLKSILYTPGYPVLQFIRMAQRSFDWLKSSIRFGEAPTTGQVLQLMVVYDPFEEVDARTNPDKPKTFKAV